MKRSLKKIAGFGGDYRRTVSITFNASVICTVSNCLQTSRRLSLFLLHILALIQSY